MRILNTGLCALALMLTVLASGCSEKIETSEPELLKADKVLYCSPDQLPIFKLALSGDTIFSYSQDKDWAFEIVTMGEDSIYHDHVFLRKGSGPDEMANGKLCTNSTSEILALNATYSHPWAMYTTTFTDVPESATKWHKYDLSTIRGNTLLGSYSMTAFGDSCVALTALPLDDEDANTLISLINYKSGKLIPLDFWPKDDFTGPRLAKFFAYASQALLFSDGGDRLVFTMPYGLYSVILKVNGNHAEVQNYLFNEPPKLRDTGNELMASFSGVEPHRLKTYANAAGIYTLYIDKGYDGREKKDYNDVNSGNTVNIFDWNGNLIKSVTLDHCGYSVMASEDGSMLYLLTNDEMMENSKVVCYNLE